MAANANNATMNRMIMQAAGRGERVGLVDRLRGTALEPDRQQRLNRALADYEAALKRGDELAAGIADTQIDRLLTEARAARRGADSSQEDSPAAGTPPTPSFDGGVRRAVSVRKPADMNVLIGQAVRGF